MPGPIAGGRSVNTVSGGGGSRNVGPAKFNAAGSVKCDMKEASDVVALPDGRLLVVGDTSDKIGLVDKNGKTVINPGSCREKLVPEQMRVPCAKHFANVDAHIDTKRKRASIEIAVGQQLGGDRTGRLLFFLGHCELSISDDAAEPRSDALQ